MNASDDRDGPQPASAVPDAEALRRRWLLAAGHRDRLVRLAASRLGSRADAEDCVQEALIRAVTHPGLDESRMGAILTAIALRLCVDLQRAAARQRRLAARTAAREVPAGAADDLAGGVCERAAGRWLLGRVAALGPRERQVMLARAAGLTTREAAGALGISRKSAESAFTRARGHLAIVYAAEMAS
jgi:RNA polymerase sigma-70 factor (ECF subfamily)